LPHQALSYGRQAGRHPADTLHLRVPEEYRHSPDVHCHFHESLLLGVGRDLRRDPLAKRDT